MSTLSTPSPPPGTGDKTIDDALAHCIEKAAQEGIPLQEALELLGPASFCFVCLVLGVPFIQPLPLGPYTMASGITFMAAGWQMAHGHSTPSLPAAMKNMHIQGKGWLGALRFCRKLLALCRKFTRPRLEIWVSGDAGTRRVGWLIFIGGFLLAIPFANLPFNNTIPALMILSATIAWLERDGLMLLVSLIWGVLTLIYFLLVGALFWFFGAQILAWFKSVWHGLNF